MNRPRQRTTKPSPEEETFKIQLERMNSHFQRIHTLLADSTLSKEQRRKLIAEELVLLQETNKSAMRVVFDM